MLNHHILCTAFTLARLFSQKTRGIAIALAEGRRCRRRRAKALTFCNISVITEDIYLKLGVCVHYPKSNAYYQGRQFNMNFFSELCPIFDLNVFFLYYIKHPTACGAFVFQIKNSKQKFLRYFLF